MKADSADTVFQGYMTSAGKPLFILSDKERTSGWLSVGQTFDGYSIVVFAPQSETLTIEKNGQRKEIRLIGGKVTTASGASRQVANKPIVISIGDGERILVGDDAAMADILKKKFELVAAMVPQPKITLRPASGSTVDSLKVVMDLCRAAGIKRFDISMQ